jgi:phosphoribosylformimino-5-aminoimidazole carboxamide ribotide isomerase
VDIYPALDIRGGRVVRWADSGNSREAAYADDTLALAQELAAGGARWLHVVDVDSAFRTGGDNTDWVRRICQIEGVAVQLGGNLATVEDVQRGLDAGADRVVLGTPVALDPVLLEQLVGVAHSDRCAVAMDVRAGRVALRGADVPLTATAVELARQVRSCGVRAAVYRDLDRDGRLAGADLDGAKRICDEGLDVIAAGGVRGLRDVRRAAVLGLSGIIVGRALHEGRLTLAEALECSGSSS